MVVAPERQMHEMSRGDALRHIGEEWLQVRLEIELPHIVAHRIDILGPALLGDKQRAAHGVWQLPQDRRHELGENLGALASAEHEQMERLIRLGATIGRPGCGEYRLADRIAGMQHFCWRFGDRLTISGNEEAIASHAKRAAGWRGP